MRLKLRLICLWALLLTITLPLTADITPRAYEVYSAANGLADNSAQTIRCTKTGRLVITTMGQINFFDGHQFTYIDPTNENIYPLKNYIGNYHLYFDKYHHLWLKNRNSVTCVNLTTEKFVDSISDVFAEFGIEEEVTDLFADNTGVVYLLLNGERLYSVATKQTFKTRKEHNLQDLEVYEDKYLLLFYDNGELDVMELSTGQTAYVSKSYDEADYAKYNKSSVLCNDGSTFYQIRNGSKESVLQSFNIGKWEWTTLMRMPYHLNNMELHDGKLYIPSEYGYWTYDTTTGASTHYDKIKLMDGRELETNVNTLAFDKQDGMWIGTEVWGLLYARPYNVPFNVYPWSNPKSLEYASLMDRLPQYSQFRDKQVNCVYRDKKGRIWVGTASGLLLYRSKSDKLPQIFTRRDGLLNNVIHSIVEDRQGRIWVGTSYGLSCLMFNGDGGLSNVLSYNSYDRIPNESFINGKAMCLTDGTIIMQMQGHVIAFNPEQMRTLSEVGFKIYPKLVKLLVNGNEIRTGEELDGKVILEKALTRTKEINVDYYQNSLSLTFSALNYFRPQQTYYRYRIKQIDDSWKVLTPYNSQGLVDGRGQLHLPLSGLKPGSYTIELQAAMTPDQWDTEPYEWIVNVNEPWWRTTGIFALVALVLLTLCALNVWFYVRNAKMKTRRYSEEQGIIRRIKSLADYCQAPPPGELLAPSWEEITSLHSEVGSGVSKEFVDAMLKIMDTVNGKKTTQLTMKMLSEKAGMDLQQFYTLTTANVYKSPQTLFKRVMLDRAVDMLTHTTKDVGDIAKACNFASPNYFIATFYHEYHLLPGEYRRQQGVSAK